MWKRFRKAALFVGLTYLVSYLLVFLYSALVGSWTMPNALVLGVAYMFVPTTVVLIVQKGIFKKPLKEPLRISFRLNRWFLAAWLLPPLIACAIWGRHSSCPASASRRRWRGWSSDSASS
jgi:hypothetical protein